MGQRFDLPHMSQIEHKIAEVKRNIQESRTLTETSKKYLRTYLTQINQISSGEENNNMVHENVSSLEVFKWFVAKEKNLYNALNNMKQGQSTYIGYFWSPNDEEREIRSVLSNYPTTDFKRFENHSITPPTYIKSNEFYGIFQEIVNTYGIPMYKEVNPAVFACVTFPFLFGVMFGDVGHGGLLFIVGILLCLFDDQIKRTSMAGVSYARYLIFLMGMFAFYNGFIYNEFFAIPLELNQSCYYQELTVVSTQFAADGKTLVPKDYGYRKRYDDCAYTFGVDSRWFQSSNNLSFTNTMKMKISVILAILQMGMGVLMKGFNAVHFKRPLDFIFEFIPQIVLLIALFGWMDILIIAKWINYKDVENDYPYADVDGGKSPYSDPKFADFNAVHYSPPVITTMIDIFLSGASNATTNEKSQIEVPKYFYTMDGQKGASISLLLIALACIPTMLCVKPCIMRSKLKHHEHSPHVQVESESVQYDKLEADPKTGKPKNEVFEEIS